jgi:hypothetical protein
MVCAFAQERDRPRLDVESSAVRDLAAVAPPELTADALLALSATSQLHRSWKIEFVQDAFGSPRTRGNHFA